MTPGTDICKVKLEPFKRIVLREYFDPSLFLSVIFLLMSGKPRFEQKVNSSQGFFHRTVKILKCQKYWGSARIHFDYSLYLVLYLCERIVMKHFELLGMMAETRKGLLQVVLPEKGWFVLHPYLATFDEEYECSLNVPWNI